jgi:hypothetical protein
VQTSIIFFDHRRSRECELLRDRAAVRVAEDGATRDARVVQDAVQVRRERWNVVGPGNVAAPPVAAQIGDDHAESARKQRHQGIEHVAAGHQAMQQQQRLAIAHDPVEEAVRRAVFALRRHRRLRSRGHDHARSTNVDHLLLAGLSNITVSLLPSTPHRAVAELLWKTRSPRA